ncbi:MAG: glycoside hydrolase family 4 [Halobacteriales archaeon]
MFEPDAGDATFEDVRIAVVGGGSRNWATTLVGDLALAGDMSGTVRLYDVDLESAQANVRLGEQVQSRDDTRGEWSYEAVETMAAALDGADVVVCSTQDPPAKTFKHDLELPAEYGIVQTVGDTVGPGGTFRAMRAIPQYREIAATVRECCPDAWVINYTNPMTVCTRTLYEEFPEINALGVCHEVYHVQSYLADLADKHLGVEATGEEVDIDVTGINHFTWLTGARVGGRDLTPAIEAEMSEREPIPGGFEPGDLDEMSVYGGHNLVSFDLYRRFGAYPAAGDRHLAEFVPWYLDVENPEALHHWGIKITPSDYRVDHWPRGEKRRRAYLEGEETVDLGGSGEEMVDIVRALLGGETLETNVNLPNEGQAPGLPEGAVVETNALLTGDAVSPRVGGRLPRQVASLIETHVHNQETLVEAGFAGDLDLAYRAFLNDPLVTIDPRSARDLFADLVEAERPYLEDWKVKDADVLD